MLFSKKTGLELVGQLGLYIFKVKLPLEETSLSTRWREQFQAMSIMTFCQATVAIVLDLILAAMQVTIKTTFFAFINLLFLVL